MSFPCELWPRQNQEETVGLTFSGQVAKTKHADQRHDTCTCVTYLSEATGFIFRQFHPFVSAIQTLQTTRANCGLNFAKQVLPKQSAQNGDTTHARVSHTCLRRLASFSDHFIHLRPRFRPYKAQEETVGLTFTVGVAKTKH